MVGQPPLKIVKNQKNLVATANSDSSDKIKGKVSSYIQDNMNMAMPQGVMEVAEKQQFNVFDNSFYSNKSKGHCVVLM